jgi:hypothetical protein
VPTAEKAPSTARALLDSLDGAGPTVEGEELAFADDPPAALLPVLRVLHTGVRALLAGRRWFGCDGETGRSQTLGPGSPVPAGVTLLSVEGDRRWDRIHPAARIDLPHLFEAAPAARRT